MRSFFRHVEEVAIRAVLRHGRANGLRERFSLIPAEPVLFFHGKGRHHVQALAASGLAERRQDRVLRGAPSISLAAAITALECSTSGAGSRSNTRRPGISGCPGWLFHGMEFDGRDLRSGDQTLDTVDLDIGLAVALDFGDRD